VLAAPRNRNTVAAKIDSGASDSAMHGHDKVAPMVASHQARESAAQLSSQAAYAQASAHGWRFDLTPEI